MEIIPVCPVNAFDTACSSFWMGSLEYVMDRYPFIGYPHRQTFYMFLCVYEGRVRVDIDNDLIRIEDGKVICIGPNSVCGIQIECNSRGHLVCFTESFFSLRYNNNVLHRFLFLQNNQKGVLRLTTGQRKWRQLLQMMDVEFCQYLQDAENVLRSYLNILLHEFNRQYKPLPAAQRTGVKEEKLLRFEKLVEENFVRHKMPSFYAGELHITTNYLNKLCQQSMGLTAGGIIRNRIILEGQRLLRYTSLTVAEVTYQLGFESPSYFITFFKKNLGVTPAFFRRNNI